MTQMVTQAIDQSQLSVSTNNFFFGHKLRFNRKSEDATDQKRKSSDTDEGQK